MGRWSLKTAAHTKILLVLVALEVGLPLLAASVSGSLRIPHNDGWAYSKIAREFGVGHGFVLVGWNRSFLLGQVVPLGPLARSLVAQQLFVAVLAAAALIATYTLLVPRIGHKGAVIATVITALWPGFALLSTSFMTDVPAYAAMLGCLALGDRGLHRSRPLYVIAAVLVGVWGATIREPAAAAPAAVAVVALARWRSRRDRLLIIALSFAAVAAFARLEQWRHHLANDGGWPPLYSNTLRFVATDYLRPSYLTLALPLLPALLAAPPRRDWRSWLVAAAVVCVGAPLVWKEHAIIGNYFGSVNAYAAATPGAHIVVPEGAWRIASAAAVVSGALLAAAIAQRWRQVDPLIGIFTGASVVLLVVQSLRGQPVFDRYLLVLLPAALLIVLARPFRYMWLGTVAAIVLAAYSSLLALDTLVLDAARWRTAERLTRSGVAANDIDAGLEWVGWHTRRPVRQRNARLAGHHSWYLSLFPEARDCYVVSASPRKFGSLLGYDAYNLFRVAHGRVWIYRHNCTHR